jgi:hypothetical protein
MARKRTTHKLRGVMLLPDKGSRKGALVGLYRSTITDACLNSGMLPLPDNFNDMHEHDRLHALKRAGVRHVPQYT